MQLHFEAPPATRGHSSAASSCRKKPGLEGARALAPFDLDGLQLEGADIAICRDDAKCIHLVDRFSALTLFNQLLVTLLSFAQFVECLIALNGTADIYGLKRQDVGMCLVGLHAWLVALHHQHAADLTPNVHRNPKPGRERHAAAAFSHFAIAAQGFKPCRVNHLRQCGAQEKLGQPARRQGALPSCRASPFLLVHLVRKVLAVPCSIVEADIAVPRIQWHAQQLVHRLQKVIKTGQPLHVLRCSKRRAAAFLPIFARGPLFQARGCAVAATGLWKFPVAAFRVSRPRVQHTVLGRHFAAARNPGVWFIHKPFGASDQVAKKPMT